MKIIKIKILLCALAIISLGVGTFGAMPSLPVQSNIDVFWAKLKTAVKNKNVDAVAKLSKLPFTMPYGFKTIRTKTQFTKSYGQIFNGEADAAKCFYNTTPQKVTAKSYEVACGFKDDPDGAGGKPIVYQIELTKTGWKLTGLDNINE